MVRLPDVDGFLTIIYSGLHVLSSMLQDQAYLIVFCIWLSFSNFPENPFSHTVLVPIYYHVS